MRKSPTVPAMLVIRGVARLNGLLGHSMGTLFLLAKLLQVINFMDANSETCLKDHLCNKTTSLLRSQFLTIILYGALSVKATNFGPKGGSS